VSLAGAAVAQGDDIVPPRNVFAPSQFQHEGFVDRGDGGKVEAEVP
jgi:hypothetical protein